MSISQPLVSIVTPVYNAEKYLAECIESVFAQTYQNWEYIILNNCSTDRSLNIATHYEKIDERIKVYNNDRFLNIMQNWNASMKKISSESKYCKVVHADDWIFPECINKMVELAEKHPSVGLVGAYRIEEDHVTLSGLQYPSTVTSGREICRRTLLENLYVFGSPTSILIRSEFVHGTDQFFNEESIHADEEVCFKILQDSDFGFIHQVLTFTRRHNESNTMFTKLYNTHVLGRLIIIKKYGSSFLNDQELNELLRKQLRKYYLYLSKKAIGLKTDKDLWRYHKRGLEQVGHPVDMWKLVLMTPSALIEGVSSRLCRKRRR